MDDPLKILDLIPGDTLDTAHKKRNALFLKLHPDKNPKDKTKYQKVYNAYETLKEHPEMLDVKKVILVKGDSTIRIKLTVTIEDFYLKRIKTININRMVFCASCGGTGSRSGTEGICPHCKGEGKLKGSILSLINKEDTCPMCKGSGVNNKDICRTCRGKKYVQETQSIRFKLNIINYHKKSIILPNVGNQIGPDIYGSVIVILNIIQDEYVKIEDNYFVIWDHILPVQKIVGDTKTFKIFGREVRYKIEQNSTDAYTIDKISPGLKQEIRIKYINQNPILTRETTQLYKKIMEIEKKNESDVFTIQF